MWELDRDCGSGFQPRIWIRRRGPATGLSYKNMKNWKDIAELIAILTIVAGLVVVIIELRQTQQALLADTTEN